MSEVIEKVYSSIDVGSNTLRLLIARVGPSGLHPILKERVITRLGEGFDGEIKEKAAERTLEALKRFKERLDSCPVEGIRVVGTSVLRRAGNREEFVERVLKETGLKIEVITGEEEALLSARGVLSVIRDGRFLIFDVGGGSTEYIFYNGDVEGCCSIDLGVVSLSEAFLTTDPPDQGNLKEMEEEIGKRLMELFRSIEARGIDPRSYSKGEAILVGTAGTPTTLAAIDQALEEYDPERINGYNLPYSRVEAIYRQLISLSHEERRGIVGLERGREDVIIPGTMVVMKTMEVFGFDEMKVSDAGLLEGVIYTMLEPLMFKDLDKGGLR